MVFEKISLSRDRLDFPDCQHSILKLVDQYLLLTDENTSSFQKKQQILTQIQHIFEQISLIVVTSKGQVQFMTQKGEQLLKQYFSFHSPPSLPESLQHWLKHQISLLTSKDKVLSSCLPLQIEQAGKQLLVRLISPLIGEQYLLLLEEQKLQTFSITSLELLGLTTREAEVLFWVAKDKSNAAIAKVLDCSKKTVGKHLEHIYEKLGVQTRTGAVVVALERLGLLQGQFVAIYS